MPKKPQTEEDSQQFNIRMPKSLIEALDAEVEEERRQHPGRVVTRSDIIREFLWAHIASRKGKARPKK